MKTPNPDAEENQDTTARTFTEWKKAQVTTLLGHVLVLGIITASLTAVWAWNEGYMLMVVFDTLGIIALSVIYCNKEASIEAKGKMLAALAIIFGVSIMIYAGEIGLLYLLASVIIGALFLNLKHAMYLLGVNIGAVLLLSIGDLLGLYHVANIHGSVQWSLLIINFVFLSTVISLGVGRLTQYLEEQVLLLQERDVELKEAANLLERINQPVVETTREGIITYSNSAADLLFGTKHVHNTTDNTNLEGRTLPQDLYIELADGKTRNLKELVRNKGGTWEGKLYTGTQTFYVQGTCLENNLAPESKVSLVGGDISELEEVIQRLEASEEIRTAFLRAVNHELRTPLTVVSGLSQTLMLRGNTISSAEQTKLVERINVNANRLTKLVTDLLDVDRMQSGKETLQLTNTKFEKLLSEALQEVNLGKFKLEAEITPQNLEIRADETKMVRVLVNLLRNAVKHSNGDSITVKAGRTRVENGGEYETVLCFCVEDNGDGINEKDMYYIFTPFIQGLPMRNNPNPGGLGLGLGIVKAVVNMHGGKVEAYNKPEKGAGFLVTLPEQNPTEKDQHGEKEKKQNTENSKNKTKNKKVAKKV